MAEPRTAVPALLVVAAFSRHNDALTWSAERLSDEYGPVALAAPPFSFHQTSYYEATMGTALHKQLLAFAQLVPQDSLPAIKLRTNSLETELAATGRFPEPRPLNLDPGLLTLGKFLLATTKDQAHRIYLGQGIYAEVTLRFEAGEYVAWPWTYADYREPEVRATLNTFREEYKRRMASAGK
jgi:hypothetical protein